MGGWVEECDRTAAPQAPALCDLVATDAFLIRAVEVRIERQTCLLRRLDKDMAERIGVGTLRDIERAVFTVKAIMQALVALGLLEVRQHVVVAPAGIAELTPMIVIGRLPAHIDHGIDRARAAKEAAARPIHAPALHRHLRRGFVSGMERSTAALLLWSREIRAARNPAPDCNSRLDTSKASGPPNYFAASQHL